MDDPDIQLCIEGLAGPYLIVKPSLIAKAETWLRDHGVYCHADEGVISDAKTGAQHADSINFGVAAHPLDLLPLVRAMSQELSMTLVEPDSEQCLKDHPSIHVDASGIPRVAKTRVTMDSIVTSFQRGSTPEQIADEYPTVPLPDIYAVVTFYLANRDQVDREMARRRTHAEEHRRRWEARPEYTALRERLLASRPAVG